MIIQASNVSMGSKRTYETASLSLGSYSGWGSPTTLPTAKDGTKTDSGNVGVRVQVSGMKWQLLTEKQQEFTPKDPVEYGSFKSLLELLFEAREYQRNWWEKLGEALRNSRNSGNGMVAGNRGNTGQNLQLSSMVDISYKETHYHWEKEEARFYSGGTVKTADGRSIYFDIEAHMSRSFEEYSTVEIDYRKAAMVDPLVINLGGNTAEVKEQKFLFDIDADGDMDNISLLSEMCGFLALDRNGDGRINDGSELFGTKSGDGFRDLAVFDMDGNGWIDENDPIFNKLRIWTKDSEGRDKLVGLGVAGVGAIYLGNVSTEFSLGDAQIRKTGIYLKENGQAGTLQHVDFAVS